METKRKGWVAYTAIVAMVAAGAFISGCGGSVGKTAIEGSGGPPIPVHFSYTGDAGGDDPAALVMKDDAVSSATGTETGTTDSLDDTAVTNCAFTVTDADSYINIITTGTCATGGNDENNCILCTITAGTNVCAIDCDGFIPSNLNADTVTTASVTHTATGVMTSDMRDANGAIVYESLRTDWTELDLTTTTFNITGCDSSAVDEMGVTRGDTLLGAGIVQTAGDYDAVYDITTVDEGSTNDTCTITAATTALITFSNAVDSGGIDEDVGDNAIDFTGALTTRFRLCDDDASTSVCPNSLGTAW